METPRTKIFRMANLLSESRDIIDTMTRERSELFDRMECLALDLDSIQKSSSAKDPPKVDISTETDLIIRDGETNANNSNITFSVLPPQEENLSLEDIDHETKSASMVSPLSDSKPVGRSDSCRKKRKHRKSRKKKCPKTLDSHWASGDVDRRLSKLLDILEPSNKDETTPKTQPKSPNHRSRLKKYFLELEKLKKQQREQDEELQQQKRFYNELRAASLGRESGGSSKESEEIGRGEVAGSGSCRAGESTLDGPSSDGKSWDKLGDFDKARDAKGERKSRKYAKSKDIVLNSESLVKNGLLQMHKKRFDEISRNRSGLESAKSLPPDFVAENRKVKPRKKNRYVHFESSQSDVESSPISNLKLKIEQQRLLTNSESRNGEGGCKHVRDVTTPRMSRKNLKLPLRDKDICGIPDDDVVDSTSDDEDSVVGGGAHRAKEKSIPRNFKTSGPSAKHKKRSIKMDNSKSKRLSSLPSNNISERKIKHLSSSSSSSSSSSRMSDRQSGSSEGESEDGDAVERFLLEQVVYDVCLDAPVLSNKSLVWFSFCGDMSISKAWVLWIRCF